MKMLILLIMVVLVGAMEKDLGDPATNQILYFKERTRGPVGVITTTSGASVPYSDAINTLNTRLINNNFFMETITHVNREKIPERIVHAKGAGAFGYFEVTHDVSHICKADFLKKVGQRTPVAVRFSPSSGRRGSPELNRDSRGFAVKFYTAGGNFDIVGFNTPMFFYKEPLNFQTAVLSFDENPATHLTDLKTKWDFLTSVPETLHMFLLVYADRGIPASYRHMPGFGIHTYQVENSRGVQYFIRFHILPDGGIKNMRSAEAKKINAMDPDYLTRDLFSTIGKGDFPCWTVSIQILTMADVKKLGDSVFDVTRVIPLNEFPLHQIGKLILNRNVKNFHADMEQLAFCPSNLVDGIHGAPDKVFEARRFAYKDAHAYRLGINSNKIPVNCPFQVKTFTYNRDGVPPVKDNEEDIPNYYPNSFYGPIPRMDTGKSRLIDIIEEKAYNFDQAAELYVNEMTTDERARLIENLVFDLQQVTKFLQERAIKLFSDIHYDLGNRIALGLNATKCQ